MLSDDDIELFVQRGWVVLEQGVPRPDALAIRDAMWEKIDASPDDPSTWTKPWVHVNQMFTEPPFDRGFNPRVFAAYDNLLGQGRWGHMPGLGLWPVLFPGFMDTWTPPQGGWHIDGHALPDLRRLDFPKRALITLFVFSDIAPGGGGTAVDEGSHVTVAQVIRDAGEHGIVSADIIRQALERRPGDRTPRGYGAGAGAAGAATAAASNPFAGPPCGPDESIVEVTANAGDVVLMHPFLLHAISGNAGTEVRFACNPFAYLKGRMRLDAPSAELSPVERAIVEAVAS